MDTDVFTHPVIIPVGYIEPAHAFFALGQGPFAFLGGNGRYRVLALDLESVPWQDFLALKFSDHPRKDDFPVFQLGFIGAVSYQSEFDRKSSHPSFVFAVHASMVWDTVHRRSFLVYSRHMTADRWQRVLGLVESMRKLSSDRRGGFPVTSTDDNLRLHAEKEEESFLGDLEDSLEDIRNGRFYQINLLRYFTVQSPVSDSVLIRKLQKRGGPFSAFLQTDDLRVVSFSPERFIRIENQGSYDRIGMYPIKGTRPRHTDPEQDQILARELCESHKDRAELNIIVDLARNDLHSVCERGSVCVKQAGELQSFPSVHHLVAEIEGKLRKGQSFADLFRALLPAASISGAPKREVTRAIFERERQARGFFMGHCFYWDPGSAVFDSSVLIRTLVGQRESHGTWSYRYAAGSGIVVNSESRDEVNEIWAKTRVLTTEERSEP